MKHSLAVLILLFGCTEKENSGSENEDCTSSIDVECKSDEDEATNQGESNSGEGGDSDVEVDEPNAQDRDGDGYVAQEDGGTDCDDTDADSTHTGIDADCDGVLSLDDCNDNNPNKIYSSEEDPDCDGVLGTEGYAYFTQSYSGQGSIGNNQYLGTEQLVRATNPLANMEDIQSRFVWNSVGSQIAFPMDCLDCVFAFELTLTYDPQASIDPQNEGTDMVFSYALGESSYGANTLFYGDEGQWSPWLVDGNTQTDLAGTEHVEEVSFDGRLFTYSQGIIDFYYYY